MQRAPALFSFVVLLNLALGLGGSSAAARLSAVPDSNCAAILSATEAELADVRADFEHNTHYTTEVETTDIKDQCAARSCWVYSGVSNIEGRILTRQGKAVDLSEQYLIVQSIRMKILEALANPGEQFAPGGSAGNVDWLIETFGAVPDAAWRPRVDFQSEALARRMYYFINARLATFHIESAKAKTEAQRAKLYKAARTDLLELVESYSGPLPESFTFEGVHYDSPLDFAAAAIPPDPRRTVLYVPDELKLPASLKEELGPRRGKKTAALHPPEGHADPYAMARLPLSEVVDKIRQALARGESVRLSYESVHEFIDDKTGIMSIGAFYVPKNFEPPPRHYRSYFDFKGTGHAVEIVGVDVGPDGKVIKFKIKNSHGEEIGDQGFFHMYWDYFAAFMTGVYIREP